MIHKAGQVMLLSSLLMATATGRTTLKSSLRGGGPSHPRRRLLVVESASSLVTPTEDMFNAAAIFATNNSQATYASTTTATLPYLFSCTSSDPDDILEQSQDAAWAGLVEYAVQYYNDITLRDSNGNDFQAVDVWGGYCDGIPGAHCGSGYMECMRHDPTCIPVILQYDASLDGVEATTNYMVDVEIYETCNFLSNWAYYRAMPQLCGDYLYMDSQSSTALIHVFASLAYGSAFFHGSHTYLGNRADVILIEILSFLEHQVIVGALSEANPDVDVTTLMNLQDTPRSKTAVESSFGVTEMFLNTPLSLWTQGLIDIDAPQYELSFAVVISSIVSIIFPEEERDQAVESLLLAIVDLLGVSADGLQDDYLPTLRILTRNLGLSDNQKFVLFRQLIGMAGKNIFALLWQEGVLKIDFFLQDSTNQIGAQIMAPLIAALNFFSGFVFTDADFQAFNGMYPGDEKCRPATQPHAKWHEISANGLLDMAYLADCTAAIVLEHDASDNIACAELASLDGLGQITYESWDEYFSESAPQYPIVKDAIPFFFDKIFYALDANRDDVLVWSDIEYYFDAITDWVQAAGSFPAAFQELLELFESQVCETDSDCASTNEACVFLTCGLQEDGQICKADSDCANGKCGYFTCGAQQSGESCLRGSDCESGRCQLGSGTCR